MKNAIQIIALLVVLLSQQAYGVLDGSFNPIINDGRVGAIALQSDGKILIGGSFTMIGTDMQERNRVARLNTDGSLDSTFANLDVNDDVWAIVVLSDDRILLAGEFTAITEVNQTEANQTEIARNGIARLGVNGALDMQFNPELSNGDDAASVSAITLQTVEGAERILLGGVFAQMGNIIRLDMNGDVDSSFNASTRNDADARFAALVRTIGIAPDNKIVVGGSFDFVNEVARNNVARLNVDGSLDTSFSNVEFGGSVSSLAVQFDNKVLIGGSFTSINDQQRNLVARLNADGSLDSSFSGALINSPWVVSALKLQSDGRVLIGGIFSNVSNVSMNANLARLNRDGTLDTSFNTGSLSSTIDAIVLQPADDNVLVGGSFTRTVIGEESRELLVRFQNSLPPNIAFANVTDSLEEDSQEPDSQEPDSADETVFTFEVTRELPANGTASVDYVVAGGAIEPANADDFVGGMLPQGTLSFSNGQTSRTISVAVVRDSDVEEDETFTVTLSNPNNASLRSLMIVQATIINDDQPDDLLCIPISTKNGNVAVVCL